MSLVRESLAHESLEIAMADSLMWKIYRYQGHRVMVIQQWADPFGRRMVRIESVDDGGEHAAGMFEQEFLEEARSEDGA